MSSTSSEDNSHQTFSVEEFIPTGYPVMIWALASKLTPGLVDTVASNIKIMLNALGVPAVTVLYSRMKVPEELGGSHLFTAVDEQERVIRILPSRLAMITSTIDVSAIKEYTAAMTSDPLGALLLKKSPGSLGERINRFPPIFGFRAPKGGKQNLYDRRPEVEALRRDGYFALTFLPVPGVDHRIQLASEIATLWGYSLVVQDSHWPDLLVLRNDNADRDDLGGVPDETWLQHALSRVLEDHLPVVEIDGLWMGSQSRTIESRARVFYAVLDWVRMRNFPYITARTFHCYVRRDLSVVVTLGSLRDRSELTEWLELYPFSALRITIVASEEEAATLVFIGGKRNIAMRDSATKTWLVVHSPDTDTTNGKRNVNLEKELREYYGDPKTCGVAGSPIKASDIPNLKFSQLLKIIRISECEAATSGICLLNDDGGTWTASHRAYRAAVRSHVLRVHDTLGVYRMGPHKSGFFSSEVHRYIPMLSDSKRYQPVVSQVSLAPDIGESEDQLLKALLGTVWVLTIKEGEDKEVDVIQVSSDRDGEVVRRVLFDAWRTGHLIGTWCQVMLIHRESLSINVAGGTVDPLVAHAGDSIVDGNRWLDVTSKALTECTSKK